MPDTPPSRLRAFAHMTPPGIEAGFLSANHLAVIRFVPNFGDS